MGRPASKAEPKKKKSFVLHKPETDQSDSTVVAESKSSKGRPSRSRRSLTDHVPTEPEKVEKKSRGKSTGSKVEGLVKKVIVSPDVAKVSPRKGQRTKPINIKEEKNEKQSTFNTDKTKGDEVSETAKADTRTQEAALNSDRLTKPSRKSKRGAPKEELKKEDLPDKEEEERPVARNSRRGKSSEAKSLDSDNPFRKESPLKPTRSKNNEVTERVETISARPGRNAGKSCRTQVKLENIDEPVNERKSRKVQQKHVKTLEKPEDAKQEIKSEIIISPNKPRRGGRAVHRTSKAIPDIVPELETEDRSTESLTNETKDVTDSNTLGKRGRRVTNKKAPTIAVKEEIKTEKEPDKKAQKELKAKKEEVNEFKTKRGRSSKKSSVADAASVEGRDRPDLFFLLYPNGKKYLRRKYGACKNLVIASLLRVMI